MFGSRLFGAHASSTQDEKTQLNRFLVPGNSTQDDLGPRLDNPRRFGAQTGQPKTIWCPESADTTILVPMKCRHNTRHKVDTWPQKKYFGKPPLWLRVGVTTVVIPSKEISSYAITELRRFVY